MYSIQPSRYIDSVKKSSSVSHAIKREKINVPRMEIDCVATTASSHAPLIPASRSGFCSRTVTAMKNVKIKMNHKKSPTNQSRLAVAVSPARITNWLPNTQDPATAVKNPDPRLWLVKSAFTRGK